MADWLNPDDYPFSPETTSNREWAWEFLRRNPAYRDDYSKFSGRVSALKAQFGKGWNNQPDAREYAPPKAPGESDRAWMLRCDDLGEKARRLPLEHWYAEKWGLKGRMGNPEEGMTPYIAFSATSPFPRRIEVLDDALALFCDQRVDDDGEALLIRDGVTLIAFDLRAPVKGQLAKAQRLLAASKSLKALGAKSVHKAKGKWVTYLRVLDGLAAGAGKAEIAKKLGYSPADHSTVTASMQGYDWVEAATRLRDHDYRYIASEE